MTFRDLKVKDVFETPEYRKVMEQYAAKLLKYPGVKLLYKKSCGEIFVVKKQPCGLLFR